MTKTDPYRSEALSNLSQLSTEEQLAFAALTRTLIRADGHLSNEENEALRQLAADFGESEFWDLIDRAAREADTAEKVEQHARQVGRPQAQELIFGTLLELAIASGIEPAEAALLDKLTGLWNITAEPVPGS